MLLVSPSGNQRFPFRIILRKKPRKRSVRPGEIIEPLPSEMSPSKYNQVPVNTQMYIDVQSVWILQGPDNTLLLRENECIRQAKVVLKSVASGVVPNEKRALQMSSIDDASVDHPDFQVSWIKELSGDRVKQIICSFPTNDWHEKTKFKISSRGGGPLFTAFVLLLMLKEPLEWVEITNKFQVISLKQWDRHCSRKRSAGDMETFVQRSYLPNEILPRVEPPKKKKSQAWTFLFM